MGMDTTLCTTQSTLIYVFYGYFNSNKVTSNFETESEIVFFFHFAEMYVKRITLGFSHMESLSQSITISHLIRCIGNMK